MNGATRVKGWTSTAELLDSWVDKFNTQLKAQTELVEQHKNQNKNNVQITDRKASFIKPSVIKLSSDQPNLESSIAECESGVNQLEDFFQFSGCSRASSGDWSSFDIQRMFSTCPLQEYV